MSNTVEHIFMCLFAISMSSVQCFFMSFLCFLIVLLLWSFESSLYSLDTNSLFDMCFINIFLLYVSLFILLLSFSQSF